MAQGKVPAEFVWIASWVSHGATPHDPHAATGMPADLWGKQGQRAWQYAGAFGNQSCNVLGLNVDINVADLGCLAPAPGVASKTAARPRLVRRGDKGELVERLTRAPLLRPVEEDRRAISRRRPGRASTPRPSPRSRRSRPSTG